MSTIVIDHLARVEGHGGITVELDGDAVKDVRFDVFEGARLLEGLVRGRRYDEIAPIVSRICSICSPAHSLTSLKATENALGVQVSPQTDFLRELLLRGESIQSHALHLFFLAVPDYLDRPSAIAVAAEHPAAVMLGLRLKRLGNLIQETIGGRAIHPVNAVPGGFGRVPSADKLIAIRGALIEAIPDAEAMLDLIASLPDAGFCHTPTAFAALDSPDSDRYYAGDQLTIVSNGDRATIPAADYRSLTNEKPVAHSHAKHSTFHGKPFMVGSLARLTVNPGRVAERSTTASGKLKFSVPSDNPMDNNKAQAVELVNDLGLALDMVERLIHDGVKDEGRVPVTPRAGTGVGVTEAPRGLLVHSYTYDEQGCVVSADVITPTAMNAASLEQHLRKTVEQSAERDDATLKKKLQMIARAYDPCISCSVHLIRR